MPKIYLKKQHEKFFILHSSFFILLLACAGLPLSNPAPTPTPSGLTINFAVTVLAPSPAAPSVITPGTVTTPATGVPIALATPTLVPLLLPTDTPAPTATTPPSPTPQPTNTPTSPLATSSLTPTQAISITSTLTPTGSGEIPRGLIALVDPPQNLALPSNVGGLEFKWQWSGGIGCRVPEGFGFEVRVWPAVTGFGPLGVMDAVKSQKDIFCNEETGIFSYRVANIKSTPGVKAMGAGKFLWDVAYVQLSPYMPTIASEPRLFEITLEYGGPLDPFGVDLNCSNFNSWAEAQAVFIAAGGPSKDPHKLDPDGNGTACDELKK